MPWLVSLMLLEEKRAQHRADLFPFSPRDAGVSATFRHHGRIEGYGNGRAFFLPFFRRSRSEVSSLSPLFFSPLVRVTCIFPKPGRKENIYRFFPPLPFCVQPETVAGKPTVVMVVVNGIGSSLFRPPFLPSPRGAYSSCWCERRL